MIYFGKIPLVSKTPFLLSPFTCQQNTASRSPKNIEPALSSVLSRQTLESPTSVLVSWRWWGGSFSRPIEFSLDPPRASFVVSDFSWECRGYWTVEISRFSKKQICRVFMGIILFSFHRSLYGTMFFHHHLLRWTSVQKTFLWKYGNFTSQKTPQLPPTELGLIFFQVVTHHITWITWITICNSNDLTTPQLQELSERTPSWRTGKPPLESGWTEVLCQRCWVWNQIYF